LNSFSFQNIKNLDNILRTPKTVGVIHPVQRQHL
jgi:hypothetical protein